MRNDLPSQGQIIEELVDRVATLIDQGKPVAFDNALAELVRYHRFVLGLGASTSPDGAAFNYAELAGRAWRPPHAEWLIQYRRLFEKGAERIPDNDHFLVSLAHAPSGLLQLPDDLVVSDAISTEVLNLFPSLIFAVEGWVTRRAIAQVEPGGLGMRRALLAGSDAKAHGTTLRRLIGAWESLLAYSPAVMDLDHRQSRTREALWANIQDAWKICWRHLINTAFCVAIATWNEDEQGAALFREALVRWPENIRHQLPHPVFLGFPEALFPDILELDWQAAQAKAETLTYQHAPAPDPGELFAAVLERVHEDVTQLLASLLAYWSVSDKQAGQLSARTASELLRGEGAEDYGQAGEPLSTNRLLLEYLRLQMVGERYQDGTYGAKLDGVISRFDSMTERDTVSGRVFRPSTLHDREGTIWADTAILAAFIDTASGATLNQRITELAEAEDRLPDGDRSLRNMLDEIDRYLSAVETNAPQILDTIAKLGGAAPEHQLYLLGDLLRGARSAITDYRARRLRERPVDPAKLEERRAAVENALLDPENLQFFKAATIERGEDPERGTLYPSNWAVPKARLVNPSMGAEISGEIEAAGKRISDRADAQSVWAIYDLPNVPVEIDSTPLERAFWEDLKPLAEQLGATPRLLLPQRFRNGLVRAMFRPSESALAGLTFARDETGRAYAGTIEGIAVHIGTPDDDTAWFLSGEKLKRVVYAPIDDDHIVSVAFEPTDGDPEATEGVLAFRYRQSFEWDESPIFKITLPRAPGAEPMPAEPAPEPSAPGPRARKATTRTRRRATKKAD